MTIFNKRFWVEAAERAIKTAAQTAVLVIGQDAAGTDLFQADLHNVLGLALGGAVLSVLTSIFTAGVGPSDTPSAV